MRRGCFSPFSNQKPVARALKPHPAQGAPAKFARCQRGLKADAHTQTVSSTDTGGWSRHHRRAGRVVADARTGRSGARRDIANSVVSTTMSRPDVVPASISSSAVLVVPTRQEGSPFEAVPDAATLCLVGTLLVGAAAALRKSG